MNRVRASPTISRLFALASTSCAANVSSAMVASRWLRSPMPPRMYRVTSSGAIWETLGGPRLADRTTRLFLTEGRVTEALKRFGGQRGFQVVEKFRRFRVAALGQNRDGIADRRMAVVRKRHDDVDARVGQRVAGEDDRVGCLAACHHFHREQRVF